MSMTLPVWVEQKGDGFVAAVLGRPDLTAVGPTADLAVVGLRAVLADHRAGGRLVAVNVPDPSEPLTDEQREAWAEVVAEIYRERDDQKAAALAEAEPDGQTA